MHEHYPSEIPIRIITLNTKQLHFPNKRQKRNTFQQIDTEQNKLKMESHLNIICNKRHKLSPKHSQKARTVPIKGPDENFPRISCRIALKSCLILSSHLPRVATPRGQRNVDYLT